MIRKWMLVLSLLMAMVLPLNAMADTQHTLSVVPGERLSLDEGITALLEVLDLRLTQGEKSGALSVLLNDENIVTIGLSADTVGLYADSNLFGDNVLYVAWDDTFALLGDLLKTALADFGVEEEELQMLEKGLAEAKDSLIASLAAGPQPLIQTPSSMEDSLEMIEIMFPDDPAMVTYIKGLYEDMTIEEGSFSSENHDTADQKYVMTMGEDDLVAICETNYMKTLITETLAMEMPEASETEIATAAEEVMAEVKKLYEESGYEMVMEMYTLNNGQTMVGMNMLMTMQVKTEDAAASMQMNAAYNRLTDENGVSHIAQGEMTADGEKVQFAADLYAACNGTTSGMIGLLADGEELVFTYEAEHLTPDCVKRSIDLYMRSGANAILLPAASDRPLFGLQIVTETAPVETLAALENAAVDTSVNILKLQEREMQELIELISTNAEQVFFSALSQLPTSTLNLLTNIGSV